MRACVFFRSSVFGRCTGEGGPTREKKRPKNDKFGLGHPLVHRLSITSIVSTQRQQQQQQCKQVISRRASFVPFKLLLALLIVAVRILNISPLIHAVARCCNPSSFFFGPNEAVAWFCYRFCVPTGQWPGSAIVIFLRQWKQATVAGSSVVVSFFLFSFFMSRSQAVAVREYS